jgi:choline dehydrogenase-like flavoprotein
MHRSPQKGVVDEHCRVHGIDNLYVAGSSVFPTAGAGTPTITIIALAIRLADHLRTAP